MVINILCSYIQYLLVSLSYICICSCFYDVIYILYDVCYLLDHVLPFLVAGIGWFPINACGEGGKHCHFFLTLKTFSLNTHPLNIAAVSSRDSASIIYYCLIAISSRKSFLSIFFQPCHVTPEKRHAEDTCPQQSNGSQPWTISFHPPGRRSILFR